MGILNISRKRSITEPKRIVYLPVEEITVSGDKIRGNYSTPELKELAQSIARYGVLQPITVREFGSRWELVTGERRLGACRLAGLSEIPCIISDVSSAESSVVALIENIQRRELNFVEEAKGIYRLIVQYGYSQEEAATKLGYSQPTVANKLRILKLSDSTLSALVGNGLTERHARALLRLGSEEEVQSALAEIIQNGLNVAQTDEYVDCLTAQDGASSKQYIIKDIRLFLNTVERGVQMLRTGGIDAVSEVKESDDSTVVRVTVRKNH